MLGALLAASLVARAEAAYAAQDYAACAALFAQAADPYNAACCHARAGDRDQAFAELAAAAEAGLRDVPHVAADPDLDSLHDDPRWSPFLERMKAAELAHRQEINVELERMFQEDQADRQGAYETIDWSKVTPRDVARRARLREILAAGGVKAADDYFHAAMLLQHGDTLADYEQAHRLAAKAAELDPHNTTARWLAAAAEDRALMQQGKPQKYATQFRKENGRWVVYTVDPAVTDDERARWSCPPLAEAQRRAEQMNRHD